MRGSETDMKELGRQYSEFGFFTPCLYKEKEAWKFIKDCPYYHNISNPDFVKEYKTNHACGVGTKSKNIPANCIKSQRRVKKSKGTLDGWLP
jgi:hypothetical protein